jgi:hypothetical protein
VFAFAGVLEPVEQVGEEAESRKRTGIILDVPADIARATSPGLVLVSGVGGPSWPEVSAAYRSAAGAATVLKTGGEGAIAVTLTAAGVDVSRSSAGRWRKLPALETGAPVSDRRVHAALYRRS